MMSKIAEILNILTQIKLQQLVRKSKFVMEPSATSLFEEAALEFFHGNADKDKSTFARRFAALFGVTLEVCVELWEKIKILLPSNADPKHLLCGIIF